MTKLSTIIKKEILPFVKSEVIPTNNRIQIKPDQCHPVILKMAKKRREHVLANVQGKQAISDADLKAKIPYGILIKNEKKQWRILAADKDAKGGQGIKSTEIIPDGQYAFIRTQQGFIRLKPIAGDANHRALSDHADKIRYAGMLYFKKDVQGEATLDYWENASGGYQPEASRSALAGLPQVFFRPVPQEKLIASPIAKCQSVESKSPIAFELNGITKVEDNSTPSHFGTNRNIFLNVKSSVLPIVRINVDRLTKQLTEINALALRG